MLDSGMLKFGVDLKDKLPGLGIVQSRKIRQKIQGLSRSLIIITVIVFVINDSCQRRRLRGRG